MGKYKNITKKINNIKWAIYYIRHTYLPLSSGDEKIKLKSRIEELSEILDDIQGENKEYACVGGARSKDYVMQHEIIYNGM